MKQLFLLLALLIGLVAHAQDQPRQHRIIMQVTSSDTLVHKGLMRQLRNIKEAAPTAQVEVVCHGPGLDLLMTDRSMVQGKVMEFAAQGMVFIACENTLRERNLDRALVMPQAGFVKAGIIRIVERQEEGWSYIKAGF